MTYKQTNDFPLQKKSSVQIQWKFWFNFQYISLTDIRGGEPRGFVTIYPPAGPITQPGFLPDRRTIKYVPRPFARNGEKYREVWVTCGHEYEWMMGGIHGRLINRLACRLPCNIHVSNGRPPLASETVAHEARGGTHVCVSGSSY